MRARLEEYEKFHTHPRNELCHWFGIPLIVSGVASLLGAVPIVPALSLSLTEIVLAAIFCFYLIEARALGAVTALAMLVIAAFGRALPPVFGLALFLAGWALQLLGHSVYEKRSPAFLGNIVHLLVGPAWLAAQALKRSSRWDVGSRSHT